MKLGRLSKTALVITLMLGQVTHQENDLGYYEDDSDFDKVATTFEGGWGWGLNSARADSECAEEDASQHSCFVIIAPPIEDPDPWSDLGSGESSDSGGSGPHSGDNENGGTEPEPEQTPEPDLTPLQLCNLSQLEDKNDCYTIADGIYNVSLAGCGALVATTGPITGAVCVTAASMAHTDAKGNCDEQYQEELYYCTLENP